MEAITPPLLIPNVSNASWDEWLTETENKLKELGYSKYKQNLKKEDFAYWKTFTDGGKNIYQIGILFYDFRVYQHNDPNANRIGVMYECMLLGGDRIDFTVSKNIDLRQYELMAYDFYNVMNKYNDK